MGCFKNITKLKLNCWTVLDCLIRKSTIFQAGIVIQGHYVLSPGLLQSYRKFFSGGNSVMRGPSSKIAVSCNFQCKFARASSQIQFWSILMLELIAPQRRRTPDWWQLRWLESGRNIRRGFLLKYFPTNSFICLWLVTQKMTYQCSDNISRQLITFFFFLVDVKKPHQVRTD